MACVQQEWAEGSVEERVQRLLKTWEMELVHKVRPEDQKSVHPKNYSATTNGTNINTSTHTIERSTGTKTKLKPNKSWLQG